jgi:hypothetical protein
MENDKGNGNGSGNGNGAAKESDRKISEFEVIAIRQPLSVTDKTAYKRTIKMVLPVGVGGVAPGFNVPIMFIRDGRMYSIEVPVEQVKSQPNSTSRAILDKNFPLIDDATTGWTNLPD